MSENETGLQQRTPDENKCRECGEHVPDDKRNWERGQLESVHAGVLPKDGEQPYCPDCAPSDQSWRGGRRD